MKQFRTILKFELSAYFHNKVFIISTIIILLLSSIAIGFPVVKDAVKGDSKDHSTITENADDNIGEGDSSKEIMILSSKVPGMEGIFKETFGDYKVIVSHKNEEEIKEEIKKGKAECAFVIDDAHSYTYYVDDLSMYDSNEKAVREILKLSYQTEMMAEGGISKEQSAQILSFTPEGSVEKLGKDQMHNFFYTYIMIFALYMVILIYGQMVAMSVASEKSSRAMELLITSAKPVSMMFGKVIASCLAGLIQMTVIFGYSLILYKVIGESWESDAIVDSIFDIPVELLVYMMVFFVLGFFIYGFLFGAISSLASKIEDVNTLVTPVVLLFVMAFIVVVVSISSGNIENMAMKICSFVPFTSPMAMFARIAMGNVPIVQIGISIVLLAAGVFITGIFAAKIYKAGVLLYGTTPKFKTIIKALKG